MRPELVSRLARGRRSFHVNKIKAQPVQLTRAEQNEIDAVAQAWRAFPDEMETIRAGHQVALLTDYLRAFDVSLYYFKPIVSVANNLEAFRCLPQNGQMHVLRGFFQHSSSVRYAFNYLRDLDAAPVFNVSLWCFQINEH